MAKATELKLELVRQGWDIKERISPDGWGGTTGYSIWVERADWHGKNSYTIIGNHVCFHGHTSDVFNETEVIATIEQVKRLAEQAWKEFPDSIPCQNAHGRLVKMVEIVPFAEGKDIPVYDTSFENPDEELLR